MAKNPPAGLLLRSLWALDEIGRDGMVAQIVRRTDRVMVGCGHAIVAGVLGGIGGAAVEQM